MGDGGEIDMDVSDSGPIGGVVTLGISIEPASSVAQQMAQLKVSSQSMALVPVQKKPDTLLLAQRIIKNAFNFLASFSGNVQGSPGNQVEVVPLKAFEEWWRKFEGRVRSDPGFLERVQDD